MTDGSHPVRVTDHGTWLGMPAPGWADLQPPAEPATFVAHIADRRRGELAGAAPVGAPFSPPAPFPMPRPDAPVLLPGTPYLLERRLGVGGMGVVYRGCHVSLGRAVAVKVLHVRCASDSTTFERLRREARAAAAVDHPQVVRVYDLGISADGWPFVVLELIEGTDLMALIDAEAPLAPDRAAALVYSLCRALAAAHAVGVVHGDVKPRNLMVRLGPDREEEVVLLDFGIAHSEGEDGLTLDDVGAGTPGYLAPEQAEGKVVDARADQYGAAMVLYHLVTGRHPFERGSPIETLFAQLTSPPRPPSEVTGPGVVSAALEAVIMRGLARHPSERFPHVAAMADALGRATGAPLGPRARPSQTQGAPDETVVVVPARRRRVPRRRASAALLVATLLVLGPRPTGVEREPPPIVPEDVQAPARVEHVAPSAAALCPDGQDEGALSTARPWSGTEPVARWCADQWSVEPSSVEPSSVEPPPVVQQDHAELSAPGVAAPIVADDPEPRARGGRARLAPRPERRRARDQRWDEGQPRQGVPATRRQRRVASPAPDAWGLLEEDGPLVDLPRTGGPLPEPSDRRPADRVTEPAR